MDWAFCENCDAWVPDTIEMAPFDPVRDEEALKARIERGDVEPLLAFERVDSGRNDYARLTLKSCSGCQRFRLVSLPNVQRSYDTVVANKASYGGPVMAAISRAYDDAGVAMPDELDPTNLR